MNINIHPYDNNSKIYNFFFHPLHQEDLKVISIITNIFLSIFSLGTWQIPFWIVNRLDNKEIDLWNQQKKTKVEEATTNIFPKNPSNPDSTTNNSLKPVETPIEPVNTPEQKDPLPIRKDEKPDISPPTNPIPSITKGANCHFAQPSDLPSSFKEELQKYAINFPNVIVHVELFCARASHTRFPDEIKGHLASGKKVVCVMLQHKTNSFDTVGLINGTYDLLNQSIPKEFIVAGNFATQYISNGITTAETRYIIDEENLLQSIKSKIQTAACSKD